MEEHRNDQKESINETTAYYKINRNTRLQN